MLDSLEEGQFSRKIYHLKVSQFSIEIGYMDTKYIKIIEIVEMNENQLLVFY